MYKFNGLAIIAAVGLMGSLPQAAQAEVKIYPYASSQNYCPAGLQPVSINGVICCGTPNTHTSYQSAMSHPAVHKKPRRVTHKVQRTVRHKPRPARAHCAIGTKGCTFD